MVDSMSDQPETVVSWRAIGAHCPVVASDGVEVGHVAEVAGHHVLAPAGDIDRITERAVYLKSASEATHNYERFHEMHVKRLGLSGLFRWKHLGWKDSPE
jgi:hypothetical protein